MSNPVHDRCGVKFKTARIRWVERTCILEAGHDGSHLSRSGDRTSTAMTERQMFDAVKALRVEPGDVLVIDVNRRITSEQAMHIQEQVTAMVPDRPVLILPPELTARRSDA